MVPGYYTVSSREFIAEVKRNKEANTRDGNLTILFVQKYKPPSFQVTPQEFRVYLSNQNNTVRFGL